MQIPVWSSFRELDASPRRFLLFMVFNVTSWQCIVGQVLVLFARHIEMPASWVGFLLSFMPLSMMLVLLTLPLVSVFGPKRLMFTGWLCRLVIASSVFIMPLAAAQWGQRATWYVLLVATLGFCLARAIGVGAWFPWLHEVIPGRQRATYFSTEIGIAQVATVAVSFVLGLLLRGEPDTGRFLAIYGVGIAAGAFSLVMMLRAPGGGPVEGHTYGTSVGALGTAWRDRPYMIFVVLAALSFSSIVWLGATTVLFMRDAIGLQDGAVMFYIALGAFGVTLTVRFWARFSDHSGSGPAMLKTMWAFSLTALLFLTITPGTLWARLVLPAAIVLTAVFGAAYAVASHRAMLNYVQEHGRVGYTTLWNFFVAGLQGLTPIGAGFLIDHLELTGFRICFALSAAGCFLCGFATHWVVKDSPAPVPFPFVSPAQPLRTLARTVWITAGLHESNRPERTRRAGNRERS